MLAVAALEHARACAALTRCSRQAKRTIRRSVLGDHVHWTIQTAGQYSPAGNVDFESLLAR